MNYKNKKGTKITDFQTWKTAFLEVDGEKHWKKGRSAYSLAEYFCNRNGENLILELLSAIGVESPELIEAEIEHENRFDNRVNGRKQDLHMIYEGENEKAIVEIEAKVDETFYLTIAGAYAKAKATKTSTPNSKMVDRIDDLVSCFFADASFENVKDIRYQLLYYLAGTHKEAMNQGINIAFMPVLVFKTKDIDPRKASRNKQDYQKFIDKVGFKEEKLAGRALYSKDIDGVKVYTCYEEISLLKQ